MTETRDDATMGELIRRSIRLPSTWLLIAAWIVVYVLLGGEHWPFPVLFMVMGASFIMLMRATLNRS